MLELSTMSADEMAARWVEGEIGETYGVRVQSSMMSVDSARQLAEEAHLSRQEAIAVVLGVEPSNFLHIESVLEWLAYGSKPLTRLLTDEKAGRLALPCTPRELARWAARTNIQLPREFVGRMRAQTDVARAPTARTKERRRRTRLTEEGIDPVIQAEADRVAAERRANNQKTRKDDIAKALASLHPDLDVDSIKRRFHRPHA